MSIFDDTRDNPDSSTNWSEETFSEPISEYAMCKKLRKNTGMGMMACRQCLTDYEWNYDNAFKHYRSYAWNGKL